MVVNKKTVGVSVAAVFPLIEMRNRNRSRTSPHRLAADFESVSKRRSRYRWRLERRTPTSTSQRFFVVLLQLTLIASRPLQQRQRLVGQATAAEIVREKQAT